MAKTKHMMVVTPYRLDQALEDGWLVKDFKIIMNEHGTIVERYLLERSD